MAERSDWYDSLSAENQAKVNAKIEADAAAAQTTTNTVERHPSTPGVTTTYDNGLSITGQQTHDPATMKPYYGTQWEPQNENDLRLLQSGQTGPGTGGMMRGDDPATATAAPAIAPREGMTQVVGEYGEVDWIEDPNYDPAVFDLDAQAAEEGEPNIDPVTGLEIPAANPEQDPFQLDQIDYDALNPQQKEQFNKALGENPEFIDSMLDLAESGEDNTLTADQMARLGETWNAEYLSPEQQQRAFAFTPMQVRSNEYTERIEGPDFDGLSNDQKMYYINENWSDLHKMAMQDPEAWTAWQNNPANRVEAIRFHARAANKDVGQGTGLTNEEHQQMADGLAYLEALEQGFGEDGVMDGSMIASDYKTFNDITDEWGPGDNLKIGTKSSLNGGFNDFVEDNPWVVVGMVAGGFLAGPATGALIQAGYTTAQAGMIFAAGSSAIQTALAGGDVKDIILNAGTAVLTSGLMDNVLPEVYSSDNFAGSFTKGAVDDTVTKAIKGDKITAEGMLVAGGTKMTVDTITDIVQDAKQTIEGNLEPGIDTINGDPATVAQIKEITNTSDIHGLLGPEGFVAKFGIDIDSLDVTWVGNTLEFLGLGDRPVHDPGGLLQEEAELQAKKIQADPNMTDAQKTVELAAIVDDLKISTAPYDERFFDVTTERSTDGGLTGIYTENPNATTSANTVTGTSGSGSSSPSSDTTLSGTTSTNVVTGIDEDQQKLPPAETENILADTTADDSGFQDTTLPEAEEIPSGNPPGVDTDFNGTQNTNTIADYDDLNATDPVGQTQTTTLPSSGGGGTAAALAAGIAGGGMFSHTAPEYKPFMASIEADFPLLSKLNLQPKDYLRMLIGRMT